MSAFTLVGGGAAYRSSLMGGFSFNSLHARRGHKLNETIAIIASLVFSPRPSSPYPNPASESMMIWYPSAIVPPRLAVFAPRATCAFDAVARITPCIACASFEVSFEFSRARFLRSRVDRSSVDG